MKKYAYGQQPSDLSDRDLKLGWARGVRHLKSTSASGSVWHVHAEMQLLYCFQGAFAYEFEGYPTTTLTAGHAIVIPPNLPHRHALAIDPAGHRLELLIANHTNRAASLSTLPPQLTRNRLAALGARICRPFPCDRALATSFAALDGLAEHARESALAPLELARARTLLCQILLDCADPTRPAPAPRRSARLMSSAVDWLEQHFAENVRLADLVAYMGYSRARLFTLFRQHTGRTPTAWLTDYRVRRARQMLTRTDLPLAAIAKSCGFATPRYFSTVFRHQTGETPTAWRKKA